MSKNPYFSWKSAGLKEVLQKEGVSSVLSASESLRDFEHGPAGDVLKRLVNRAVQAEEATLRAAVHAQDLHSAAVANARLDVLKTLAEEGFGLRDGIDEEVQRISKGL